MNIRRKNRLWIACAVLAGLLQLRLIGVINFRKYSVLYTKRLM